jgi:hypothetical protein
MFAELVESLIVAELDRAAMIGRVTVARREAQAAAERVSYRRRSGDLAALADIGAWAEVERIGHLLFYLRFDKVPMGASAEELALINRLDEELQRRRRCGGSRQPRTCGRARIKDRRSASGSAGQRSWIISSAQ